MNGSGKRFKGDADGSLPSGWALKSFQEGHRAASVGVPFLDNPYPQGSNRRALWEGGWQIGATEMQSTSRVGEGDNC